MKEPKPKKSRQKHSAGKALSFLLWMVLGGLLGYMLAKTVDEAGALHGADLPQILYWVLAAFVALYAQIILHEGGHLVCGLLTGYQFISFRIGNWMWQKENGRIRLRRFSLAGTGGQCLLAPPEWKDGKMPCVLYNLGGPLANLLTAVLCGLLAFAFRENTSVQLFFAMQALVGLMYALLNGIPMDGGEVCNDGKNILMMRKDPAARRSFWVQLRINAEQVKGVRLKDMPEEWFAMPTDAQLRNGMTSVTAVLRENRLMDEHRFAEAVQLMDELEQTPNAVIGLHRNLLLCDRLYCALVLGEDAEPYRTRWNSKEMQAFRKQMKEYLSIMATEYTVALLAEKDRLKAEAVRLKFEKRCETYPYAGEVESAKELISIALGFHREIPDSGSLEDIHCVKTCAQTVSRGKDASNR